MYSSSDLRGVHVLGLYLRLYTHLHTYVITYITRYIPTYVYSFRYCRPWKWYKLRNFGKCTKVYVGWTHQIKINHDQIPPITAPLITSCFCISQSRITFMISGKKWPESIYIQNHHITPIATIPIFLMDSEVFVLEIPSTLHFQVLIQRRNFNISILLLHHLRNIIYLQLYLHYHITATSSAYNH